MMLKFKWKNKYAKVARKMPRKKKNYEKNYLYQILKHVKGSINMGPTNFHCTTVLCAKYFIMKPL